MNPLFKEIMVWERLDDKSAVRYCCLENLANGTYAVQSADFFRLPLPLLERALAERAIQFVELLIEVSPLVRCTWFSSISEAIDDHQRQFSE